MGEKNESLHCVFVFLSELEHCKPARVSLPCTAAMSVYPVQLPWRYGRNWWFTLMSVWLWTRLVQHCGIASWLLHFVQVCFEKRFIVCVCRLLGMFADSGWCRQLFIIRYICWKQDEERSCDTKYGKQCDAKNLLYYTILRTGAGQKFVILRYWKEDDDIVL